MAQPKNKAPMVCTTDRMDCLKSRGRGQQLERRWTPKKRLDACSSSCTYNFLERFAQSNPSNKTSTEPDVTSEVCNSLIGQRGRELFWSLYCCDMDRCHVATPNSGQSRKILHVPMFEDKYQLTRQPASVQYVLSKCLKYGLHSRPSNKQIRNHD